MHQTFSSYADDSFFAPPTAKEPVNGATQQQSFPLTGWLLACSISGIFWFGLIRLVAG